MNVGQAIACANEWVAAHGAQIPGFRYSVVSVERYRSAEEVLANPELASNLAAGGILADPLGLLTPLQRTVADQYAQPRWVRARCVYEKQIVGQALDGQAGAPFEALLPLGTLAPFLSGLLAEASLRPHLRRLPKEQREAAQLMLRKHGAFNDLPADVALFWADGRRTLAEILDLTELETEVRDAEGLAEYFRLLARLGLVELRSL